MTYCIPDFTPVVRIDGYLPIADHGLIGNGSTAALVGRDGAIDWLCLPRFDSPPLFCRLLDAERGGAYTLAPEGLVESRQYYLEDSGVLVTEMRGGDGLLRVIDALTLRAGADLTVDSAAGRKELLRSVHVLQGRVRLLIDVSPYGGAQSELRAGGIAIRCRRRPELDLQLWSSRPLPGLRGALDLAEGDRLDLMLHWEPCRRRDRPVSPEHLLQATVDGWQRWIRHFRYDGPQAAMVRRSTITLKLLDHFENGAIVAAPTSSLPEAIGGPRNWDYRYAWIRDAAFSVYALYRIGYPHEAAGFLGWVMDAVERHGRPKVLYNLDGENPPGEREDVELRGYRHSRPVRWGNGAADQRQNDVYGEILDSAYQWAAHHGDIDRKLWQRLRDLVEAAGQAWREPDHGIWEVRSPVHPFTYSVALCQVALERGARLAERFGLPGDIAGWRAEAQRIRATILEQAWNPQLHSLTAYLGGRGMDASLLALPLRRVIAADHPKMVATTEAIVTRLSAGNGLRYRYLPDELPDGLEGHEGAFLLCSFWLVDNLANQGRMDEAMSLYESLCARANPLGLLAEQIDPASGDFLGNFPQAFSHYGLISSGVNLARLLKRQAGS